MDSSLYVLVEDLRGVDAAGILAHGVSSITVGAAYHRARDVTPHGRSRVTFRHDGVHFPLDGHFDGLRSPLTFVDLTGAMKGYADGLPTGEPAAADAWQVGIDPASLAGAVPSYAVLCYAREAGRIAEDVAAYRAALGPDTALRAVLRPGRPDTASAEHLAAKAEAARASGADTVDFYQYGLVPLPVLDRIAAR